MCWAYHHIFALTTTFPLVCCCSFLKHDYILQESLDLLFSCLNRWDWVCVSMEGLKPQSFLSSQCIAVFANKWLCRQLLDEASAKSWVTCKPCLSLPEPPTVGIFPSLRRFFKYLFLPPFLIALVLGTPCVNRMLLYFLASRGHGAG